MGIINLFSRDSLPRTLEDWNVYFWSEADKKTVFDACALAEEVVLLIIEYSNASALFFKCGGAGKRCNRFSVSCDHMMVYPNCLEKSILYYKYVECCVSKKLHRPCYCNVDKINKMRPFVLLFDNQNPIDRCDSNLIQSLVQQAKILIVADAFDKHLPIVLKAIEYKRINPDLHIVSCGNPLFWDKDYIGKNTKAIL